MSSTLSHVAGLDCRSSLQVPCRPGKAGDLQPYEENRSTTCVNGAEKRAGHFGVVARPVQGMWLLHTLTPVAVCSDFSRRANHQTRTLSFRVGTHMSATRCLVPWTHSNAESWPSSSLHHGRITVDWWRGSGGGQWWGAQNQLLRAAQCGEDGDPGRVGCRHICMSCRRC